MTKYAGKLEVIVDGVGYWCPSCEEVHYLNTLGDRSPRWGFNGDFDKPTFTPSVKVTGKQSVNKDGVWTGEWKTGPDSKALDLVCHVFVTDGIIQFLGDCTDPQYAGRCVPLTEVPENARRADGP